MKQIIKYISVLMLLLCSTEAFARLRGSDIAKGTIVGGDIAFYLEESCQTEINHSEANATVYIKATPDGIHVATGATLKIEKTVSSDVAQSRTRTDVGMGEYIDATEVGGGVYSFVMPDDANISVIVSATLAEKPTTSVKYLDADGKEQTADGVYILDGTEKKLGVDGKETWFVAQGKLDYNDWLRLYDKVHLILADGSKMTVETDKANAIDATDAQLFVIYAQSNNENAGALTAISTHEGNAAGAISSGFHPIIINGGYITAKCTSTRTDVTTGYAGIAGAVTINGGHIVATSASSMGTGISGNITIGYNNPNVSFSVTGFNGNSERYDGFGGSVKVAEGKVIKYTDDNNEVHELTGTLCTNGDETIALNKLIAGKTLRPASAYKLSVDNNLKAYLAEEIKEEYVYKDTKITLKPIAHYVFETINNNGTALETTFADGVYTFDMPAADVVIKATAKKLLTSNDISIADIAAQIYTGSEIKPVVVKDGETDITDQCNIVYTNNTNVGTATATITAKAESAYSGTVTKTFTISAKPLTITAEAKTKVFGTDDPALTYTVEGLIEGESLTGALTRAEGEAVGEYDITQGTLAASDNYSVTFTGAKFTITAATISGVTATDYSGTYDGAAHTIGVTIPEGAAIMYGTAEGTYDKEAAPSFTNVGEYTVYYQVTKANHNTVTGSAKVAISKKALTITAEAKTKVFGTDDPALTYTVEGLIEGESLTGALTRTEGEAVGDYDITQGTLAASDNYSVTFVGAKLTITAATISGVTATDYSGTYDGAAHTIGVTIPEGATIMYGTAEGTYDKEAAPSYTNAGEYTVYYQVTKANHNTATGSAKVTISKKALIITAEAKSKVEGEADPELTYTVEGLIEGESLTGALTRAEGEAVGEYDITQGTLAASNNYSVTFVSAKFTITAATTPADPEPNTEVVNTEDPVTEGGETFYQPSQTVQDAISNKVNTGISFSAEASKDVKVNENGGLEFGKSDKNVDVALTDMKKGETVTFNIEGSMQADASKLRERAAAGARGTRSTRADGKIDIVSGKEYEVLEDGNIVITVVLTESAATINSITKTAASATGIQTVDSLKLTVDRWYSLDGHRLQSKPTVPGIYINNGKKVVVK